MGQVTMTNYPEYAKPETTQETQEVENTEKKEEA